MNQANRDTAQQFSSNESMADACLDEAPQTQVCQLPRPSQLSLGMLKPFQVDEKGIYVTPRKTSLPAEAEFACSKPAPSKSSDSTNQQDAVQSTKIHTDCSQQLKNPKHILKAEGKKALKLPQAQQRRSKQQHQRRLQGKRITAASSTTSSLLCGADLEATLANDDNQIHLLQCGECLSPNEDKMKDESEQMNHLYSKMERLDK